MARDALKQPFVSTSIWNTPLSSTGVSYTAANLTPATGQGIRGSPIALQMDPTQPLTPIYPQSTAGLVGQTNCILQSGSSPYVTVPMSPNLIVPSSTQGGSSDNSGFSCVHADGHSFAQGAQFARCGTQYEVNGVPYATAGKCDDNEDLTGDGLKGDTGASHLPINGGVIRLGEISPGGVINHALQVIAQSKDLFGSTIKSQTYRWPSTTSDGYATTGTYAGTNPKLTMGALLALKPTFNLGQLVTTPAKILATAFMNYGGYITNTIGGSNTVCVEVSGNGTGSQSDVRSRFQTEWGVYFDQPHGAGNTWVNDCILIFANLFVVDSLTQTSYGRVVYPTVGAAWDGATGTGAPPASVTWPLPLGTSTAASIARVGATVASATTTSGTPTITRTLTAGNGLILCIASYDVANGRNVNSVSDGNNTYVSLGGFTAVDNNRLHTEIWLCKNVAVGGAQTITVTMSTATGATTLQLIEVSGQDAVAFRDVSAVSFASSAAPSVTAGSPTSVASEFALGFIAYHGATASPTSPTWGSTITGQTVETLATSTVSGLGLAAYVVDGIQAAQAAQSFSATIATNPWTATMVTFLPAVQTAILPGVLTGLTALAGNAQTTVSWTLPAVVGTGITSTVVTPYIAGIAQATHTASGTATSLVITGETNGTTYTWSAHCVNASGAGPETALPGPSSTPAATPAAPSAPSVPVIDSIGSADILYDWGPTAPNPGTQPITSYSLRITQTGTGVVATFTVNDTNGPGGGPSLSFDATGIPLGVPLTGAAAATNSVGTSAYSAESASVTLFAPPPPPTPLIPAIPVPSGKVLQAPNIFRDVANIQTRLRALETQAPAYQAASDSSGQLRYIIGALDVLGPSYAGLFGLVIFDANGTIVFTQTA